MVRVLVVEDNSASLDLMVYLLKAFGHTPLSARDGLEGIAAARREHPDLILCDIQLPGADGVEVCRQLKADPASRDIPMVAVTAFAMVGDREKLLAHGFNGYLSKPINPQTFIADMAPYLLTPKVEPPVSATTTNRPPVKVNGATVLVVDNSPENIKLSRSILESFGYRITAAHGVDEAMALLRAQPPDLILSDLHMPVKDGFDFIKLVKADVELRKIPFVLISSTVWGDRERVNGLSLGAAEFIIRPIEPRALVDQIESCRNAKPEVE
ncbi:MAG TPA: response regulator [Pyrinomonadaceae bacterium]|nr:response regulator [Pyrinomonadaceae bacterium]